MKTIILCGGKGTRMKEETEFKPKPLVEIGGRPILWHIMKIYAHYGFREFILALGYKGEMIIDYFLKHKYLLNDFTLDTGTGSVEFHDENHDNLKITFVDTGAESLTGERIMRVKKYLDGDQFMVTYGDGVSDIDIKALVDFHNKQNKIGTISGVQLQTKYGLINVDETGLVKNFRQKPLLSDYVSGGFMVFNKKALDYINTGWIESSLEKLADEGQLAMHKHDGFWKAVDTYNELTELNKLWEDGRPWAVWEKN
ncbi:MAG: glucose-1-phosphate cytidylyltransferase [Candidatus Doudnabacteria bacterium RIFCSPHIGHO2_01_FULL_46_14]|uniref:Glucose-1-phosphate cytidylyltransferase n=1 Tax=Candidatus Doudnabacteria bacterium RIFCSPHIGHO2_01_FULL_46_14 TaxID=1817824 RepID=A0A1F5NKV6_9BACT|nr:MAG: glucose-1-phosphate cytidylyltransferase [Candidatus Doudnabacteria bacterium RIFCSPHIGHO2_01_FULL_46_14]